MLAGQIGFGIDDDDMAADARQRKAQRIVSLIMVLVGLAGFAWSCWVLYQDSLYGWQTTNWNGLEFAAFLPFPFLFLLFVPALSSQARRNALRRTLDPLRLTRLSTNLHLAPPATLQPAPLSPDEQVETATFTALRSAGSPQYAAGSVWTYISFAMFMVAMLVIIAPLAFGQGFTTSILGIPNYLILIPVYVLAIGGVFVRMFRMMRGRKGLTVTADTTGLRWRRGRGQREQSLVWSAISLFAKVSMTSPYGIPITVFSVESTDMPVSRLTWVLVSTSKAREYAESDLLSRLIVTRSGQPLRDFTSIAAEVAQARNNPERLRTLGLPDEAIEALAGVKRYVRRTLWSIVPVVLILALFIGGSSFASARLQDYQQSYFAGLVGKLHAETPLFSDPMSADDGQWAVEKPSAANNQSSYAFVDGAYQMSGQSGQFVAAFAAPVYGDAAVEVTVRQVGAAQIDTSQGVGLVLRSNGGTNMIVFYVSTVDGTWSLEHYLYNAQQPDSSWDYMGEGNSSAIQQGAGATNQLLVLARGQTYLLYINDRFITAYTDRYHDNHDLQATGQVGVYVSDGAITGSFTDFAVYPVQSPPSLSYV